MSQAVSAGRVGVSAVLDTTVSKELQKRLWPSGPVGINELGVPLSQICLLSLLARLGCPRVREWRLGSSVAAESILGSRSCSGVFGERVESH